MTYEQLLETLSDDACSAYRHLFSLETRQLYKGKSLHWETIKCVTIADELMNAGICENDKANRWNPTLTDMGYRMLCYLRS